MNDKSILFLNMTTKYFKKHTKYIKYFNKEKILIGKNL